VGLIGNIGPVPEEWRVGSRRPIAIRHDGMYLLTLAVRVQQGAVQTKVLAISYDKQLLQKTLADWLEDSQNSAVFLDYVIQRTPFITGT